MALPHLSPLSLGSTTSSRLSLPISAKSVCRLQKNLRLPPNLFNGSWIHVTSNVREEGFPTVRFSLENLGETQPKSEGSDNSVSVENLPLESKLQLKLEQKMRMKLTKKIRLGRKRLVRKRHLRKKGRWPPSKMKKNKNV